LALAHLPPGSAAGQAGRLPFKYVTPPACPALRRNCLQDSRARALSRKKTAGFRSLRAALLSAVLPFGQKPAHIVSVMLFLNPPETRKFVGLRRALHSVVPFQQIIAPLGFVLADKDCGLDSNFIFSGLPKKIKSAPTNCFHFTSSLRSLRL